MPDNVTDVADWWQTSIIDMEPGKIVLRGHKIEELIGAVTFPQMIWLMLRGELPAPEQSRLLEAALVSAVDHGPQAPSIATARMAITCGLGLNGALASAVNMLDDVHGGAGEQAIELFKIAQAIQDQDGEMDVEQAASLAVERWQKLHGKIIPGFGHRFHKPTDPRTPPLLSLVADAASSGVISGEFAAIAQAIGDNLEQRLGYRLALNIDGVTAVIYAELGFDPPLARGLFCLSRSVGVIAHAWEQMQQGGRNKGPTPPDYRWTYTGPNPIQPREGDA